MVDNEVIGEAIEDLTSPEDEVVEEMPEDSVVDMSLSADTYKDEDVGINEPIAGDENEGESSDPALNEPIAGDENEGGDGEPQTKSMLEIDVPNIRRAQQ